MLSGHNFFILLKGERKTKKTTLNSHTYDVEAYGQVKIAKNKIKKYF